MNFPFFDRSRTINLNTSAPLKVSNPTQSQNISQKRHCNCPSCHQSTTTTKHEISAPISNLSQGQAAAAACNDLGAGDFNRRWLFNNPSTINGVGVGVPMSPNPKMHLEPIKVQPKNVTRGNNGNAIICKSNAPALSINGLGCDILSQINEITDGLYLCGARAMRAQHLLELGITNVVNVTVELPCLNIDEIESMKIQLDDSPYANLSYYFDRVADKVDEVRRKGGRIVIHCVAGVSRSATLIIAYLIKYKKMTLRQAYNFVKARRCCIRPNVGFFRQLVDYESRLMGCTSVKMVWNAAAGGYIPDVYEPEYNNTLLFLKKYGLQSDRLGRCAGERYRR